MSCITVFGRNEQDEKSILKKKLISHFKRDGKKNLEESKKLADYVYNDIIATPSSIETSFNSYMLKKKDFETYVTGEPTIEEFFEWRNYLSDQNKMKKVFSTNDFMSTQREFIDLADGFTAYLFETLYDKGFTPNDLFEEGAINIRENNILNITLNKVLDELREEITYLEDDVSIARIADMIDAIETNKVDFLNTYNNYLDSTFGFKINAKSIQEQEDMDTDESKETKDLAYSRVAHEFDQKDGASKAIKMLIAGLYIPAGNDNVHVNNLGLMSTTNYAETFNFVHQILMDIPPSIENYINVLKDNVHRRPELQVLINRLNFSEDGNYVMSSDPDVAAREQLLRTQFVNQFDKSNMEFTIHIKREDGTISAIDANMDKVEDVLLSRWATNFQQNIQNNPNLISDIFETAGSNKLKFFQLLGLDITDTSIIPDSVHSNIYNFGIRNKTEQEIFDIYKPNKNEGVKSQLKYIANKVALQSPDVIDFQHYSSEGKLIYGITLNTHLSSMVKDLAYYAGQENKIAELYPQLFDSPYTFDGMWLRKIAEGNKMKMGVYDGFKNLADGKASSTKELKAKDLNVQRVVGMLMEGKYPFLRSADRGTENYFAFEDITRPIIGGMNHAREYLFDHLESEIMTMQSTVDVAHFEKNNSDFRVFHVERNGKKVSLLEEFNPEIRKIITKIENENKKSSPSKIILRELESTLLKERKNALDSISNIDVKNNGKVIGFIDELMESVIKKEEAFLTASGVLDTDINGNYKHLSEVVKEYKGINAVIGIFALNSFIANIEQTKLFVGDPAFYKNASDIFKRMSMFNSTKESARIDQEMLTYLSTLTNEFEAKHGYKIPRNNNTIRTISMRDVESTANEFSEEFHNMLIEMFEENSDMYMDAYNKMNEADGFAFMTLDEYRIAGNRYGQWFPAMEATYQKILNDPTNVSSRDIMNFTPWKLQYTGRLTNIEGMDVPAGRKFAVIPLVPTMIGNNTALAKLNEQMLSNGVGMAFFESAAKFGHGELYEMYDENGNFNIELNQESYFDELDYKYMGNQLKINNEAKENITASTQKRKNMLVNIFNNGRIDLSRLSERQIEILMEEYNDTDIESILEKESEKMGALVDEYDSLQSLIVEEGYKKATDGLGKEGNLKEKSALNRFVDGLLQQGLRQGYTVGELSSLHELKENPILEILGNKQRVENLIMAKLSRNAISNKRGGDSLAQIPDVGFEITDRVEEESSRHNLKFYERSKDGKKLLPMEIMVALPKEMESYVAYNYGNRDGNLTSDKLDAFNDAIAEDDKRFREKGEHSELSRMITYIGFRIPNQGASSSDVAKVKKFFPPYMHGSVAVPKPIVAKTGSDFDIDKMNFYKPHFRQVRENERGHAETFADTFLSRGEDSFELAKNIMAAGFDVNPNHYKTHNVARGAFISRVLLSNEPSDSPGIQQIRDEFQNYLNSNESKVTALEYIQGGTENKMQIDNRLIEIEEQLTLHMANERQLLTPLTDTRIKAIVRLIRELRGEPVVQEDHISDIFTNKTNVEKFISFLSGLGGVGQTAVHIPNHAMAQKAGLKMLALHNYFGMGSYITAQNDNNLNKISFGEIDSTSTHDYYTIQFEGKTIGKIDLNHYGYIDGIEIEAKYRNKGLGKSIYRKINSELLQGNLKSDSLGRISEDAKRVWESLIKSGEAIKTSDGYSFIQSNNTVQDLSGNTYSVNESDIITYETEFGPIRYIIDENGDMVMLSDKNTDTVKDQIKGNYYEGNIKPEPNTIFVFGSNPIGVNGNPAKRTGGAALVALEQFGVKQGEKMDNKMSESGNAFGLTTVTRPGAKRSKTPEQIIEGIKILYETAKANPNKNFKVAYRNTTTASLNGYTGLEMIEMFQKAGEIPPNVIFSKEWSDIMNSVQDNSQWIDMGNIDSIDGVNISEILSEIITSFVDVAKDPYILDINAVQSTTNTIMMMIRQGMPLETVFLFMNQPIIRDYVRQQQLNESIVSGENALEKAQLVSKVLSEFGENPNVSDMIYRTEEQIADGKDVERKPKIYNDIDINNLKDNIRKGKKATNQKQMLDLFLEYQRQSRIFGAMVRSTSPDTKGFKNLNTLMTQLQERIDVEESGMFLNYDKMFEGFVGTYHDAKESYQNLVKDIFLLQQEAIVGEINKLKDAVITKFMDQDTKDRILTLIDNEAVSHMFAVTGQINYKEDFRRLFTGPRSIPKVVKEIQEFIKDQGLKNAFFDNMLPLINETREGYDSMKPKTKKLTTTQKERMAVELSDFIDYYESNGLAERFGIEDFRNDILKYQMIQSGIKNSPYSFMEMMDPSDYHNMSKVAVNLTKDDVVKWLDFANTNPEYQPSPFIMHHLNEFYTRAKRKDFPWEIGYDANSKLFYVIMQLKGGGTINLQQVGRGVRFMMYGVTPLHFHGRVGQSLDTELGNNNC